MPSFLEQLRAHLAPRFRLGEELGHGGMGVVYKAQDTRLPRAVAVKTLSHQDANASAEARFLNEARRLAEVHHPNVVAIYEVAPEGCPFSYFIMEFLEGQTLEQRLAQGGPLSPAEVRRLGRQLLAALGAAHRRGVIHRDVKPSNIYLEAERAVLTDFGIAKSTMGESEVVTQKGQIIGTEKYMAPEQRVGHAAPQSDFYALAIVLYESLTGEDWADILHGESAHWSKVPMSLRGALQRALAPSPAERFPDAAAFDRALQSEQESASGPGLGRVGFVAGVAVAVAVIWLLVRPLPEPVDVAFASLRVAGTAPPWLGDSLVRRIVNRLGGYPDFTIGGPGGRWRAKARVSGSADVTGQQLTVSIELPNEGPIELASPVTEWRGTSDALADTLLTRLYSGSPLDSQMPTQVLPRSPAGMQAFLEAEQAFARAWWDSAYELYERAARLDTTCVLCRLRHVQVGRFLSQPEDSADQLAYRARVDGFPPQYQALIRAELAPLRARLDSLDRLNQRWPKFLFGRFRYADELIHRGPLIGRARREASLYFERTSDVRRDFVPAWEHLLWLWVAEGNAKQATADLDTLNVLAPQSTSASRDLLGAAFAWRFLPPPAAVSRIAGILPVARARHEPVDAGARYLNAFDAQTGAIWLGTQLDSANDHRESAQLAELFGYFALGRPHEAAAVETRLVEQFGDPVIELFALELEATQMMVDPDSGVERRWEPLAARLHEFAQRAGGDLRPRAEWMAALLAQHVGRQTNAADREAPAPLATLLNAESAAASGAYEAALKRTDSLVEVESAAAGDPFFRTILHLVRAQWELELGRTWSADRELIWYQNTDVIEYPSGAPQPSEVDWAFGVLARWRRAGLKDLSDDRCRIYQDVARLWAEGEPRYAARADSARRAVTALRCPAFGS